MEPIDQKHIAAINERLAKGGSFSVEFGPHIPLRFFDDVGSKTFQEVTDVRLDHHPEAKVRAGRSHASDVLGYATHNAFDSDGKRVVATITGDGLTPDSEARLKLGAAFASGFVLGLVLMFMFFALAGCSREQPIARQLPANRPPISSSTDAFNSTDADLDRAEIARQMEQTTKEIQAQTVEALKVTAELNQINKRMQAAIDRREHTATVTTQPLRKAETRRVTFAGVAFSDRAIATIVQLSNKPCLTRYNMVPLSANTTAAERQRLETEGRIQHDWRWPDLVRIDTVDEAYCDPDFAMIRIPNAGSAVKFEIVHGARGVHYSRTFYRASFRTTTPAVTLPVELGYPRGNAPRFDAVQIIVIGMDAQGSQVFMLPETKLSDLPRWVEP